MNEFGNNERSQSTLSTQGAKYVAINVESHPSNPFATSHLGGHPIDQPRTGPNKRCALSNELVSHNCERSHSGRSASGAVRAGPYDTYGTRRSLSTVVDQLWAIQSQVCLARNSTVDCNVNSQLGHTTLSASRC
jgi:hypothetical protein